MGRKKEKIPYSERERIRIAGIFLSGKLMPNKPLRIPVGNKKKLADISKL